MQVKRYFSWREANALVPRLTEIFGVMTQLRSQLARAASELARQGAEPVAGPTDRPDSPEVIRLRALFHGLYEAMAEQLREVEDLGALVKDMDGLVDFLHRRGDRDVLLCWRLGEAEIGHWHDLESGFAGRHPLDPHERDELELPH
jgi:hypothetical protein